MQSSNRESWLINRQTGRLADIQTDRNRLSELKIVRDLHAFCQLPDFGVVLFSRVERYQLLPEDRPCHVTAVIPRAKRFRWPHREVAGRSSLLQKRTHTGCTFHS
jgi:hypothetical protein